MEPLIKNLPHARPFPLKDQVGYEPGKVVSLTLAQRPGVGMTLFAFDAGEAISTHAAPGDAMATILEGTAQITIDGVPHTLNAGEAVITTRTTTIKLSFNGNLRRIKAPEATESHVMSYVLQYKPVDAFWYTNGLMGASNGKNPYGMTRTGKRPYEDTHIFNHLTVEQDLPLLPGPTAN